MFIYYIVEFKEKDLKLKFIIDQVSLYIICLILFTKNSKNVFSSVTLYF